MRRRFTLGHEFKHVLDHVFIDGAYLDARGRPSEAKAEAICDYFAACLLMPRPWIKQAWVGGVQDQRALAQLFGVSEAAMALRLRQLGITTARRRWAAVDPNEEIGVGRYFRRGALVLAPARGMVVSPLLAGSRG